MRFTFEEHQFTQLKDAGLVTTGIHFLDYQWAINHKPGQLDKMAFVEAIERDLLEQLKAKYGDTPGNSPSHH